MQEYLVWRTQDNIIDWFVLRDGRYDRLPQVPSDEHGLYKSETFPGLWLDATALLQGDLATVLKVLGEGLASSVHAVFAEHLQEKIGTDK